MQVTSKERVLLVDDEPQILLALEDLLGDLYTVFKSETPERALDLVSVDQDIAVVITDQRMPTMNGDEFLRRISRNSRALRIMVSGFADLPAVLRAVNEGKVFAYVTKPWDESDLRTKVQTAVEHFRLTQELEYERRLLRDLMDNSPDGIYFKDAELRFLRANEPFARLVGRPDAKELVGLRLSDVLGAANATSELEAEDRQILSDRRPIQDAIRRHQRAGKPKFTSETKAAIQSPSGEAIGLVGISRDVTERVNLEQQLAQSQKMEAIGQLAGGVAHDFNNLLSVIIGCSELALEGLVLGDSRSNVAEALAAARRGSLLTKQLLAFSRRQIIEPKDLQLNDVVTGIESMLRRLIGGHIEISTVLRPDLGLVRADQSQLEQIIVNLTVNARDAMPEGGVLRIETEEALLGRSSAAELGVSPGRFVALTIMDTGQGMTDETRQRLFEPFFTTKELGKGTGLGLSTVYGIVQQSGGHIRVLSGLGEGTEFRILLPRISRGDRLPPSTPPEPGAPPVMATILLLQDDDTIRLIAARILRSEGHTVLEASRASEARNLLKVEGARVDLLLSDTRILETTGAEFLGELAAAWPNIQIIFMTGGGPALGTPGKAVLGNSVLLAKPFSRAQLLEKIQAVMSSRNTTPGVE